MAHSAAAEDLLCLESEDALTAGTLGFMPRVLVLATLPHRWQKGYRFERVNGRHTLRMSAPRRVGLQYDAYPRLLLAYLTTQAVRTKCPKIQLGATPNDLARKLRLTTISGSRGTAARLVDQLRRLDSMRLEWETSFSFAPRSSGAAFVTPGGSLRLNSLRSLLPRRPNWRSQVVLSQDFFEEITRSAVPVDLGAVRHLHRSSLAIDLYVWLTYRMSYLRRPTLVPWKSLEAQFGSDYARQRDFRRRLLSRLAEVVAVYPPVRLAESRSGLLLQPSAIHVARVGRAATRFLTRQRRCGAHSSRSRELCPLHIPIRQSS